jgi:hypothetical protein
MVRAWQGEPQYGGCTRQVGPPARSQQGCALTHSVCGRFGNGSLAGTRLRLCRSLPHGNGASASASVQSLSYAPPTHTHPVRPLPLLNTAPPACISLSPVPARAMLARGCCVRQSTHAAAAAAADDRPHKPHRRRTIARCSCTGRRASCEAARDLLSIQVRGGRRSWRRRDAHTSRHAGEEAGSCHLAFHGVPTAVYSLRCCARVPQRGGIVRPSAFPFRPPSACNERLAKTQRGSLMV